MATVVFKADIFKFQFWDVIHNFIPNMCQMVFPHVPVKDGPLTLMYIDSFIALARFWFLLLTKQW